MLENIAISIRYCCDFQKHNQLFRIPHLFQKVYSYLQSIQLNKRYISKENASQINKYIIYPQIGGTPARCTFNIHIISLVNIVRIPRIQKCTDFHAAPHTLNMRWHQFSLYGKYTRVCSRRTAMRCVEAEAEAEAEACVDLLPEAAHSALAFCAILTGREWEHGERGTGHGASSMECKLHVEIIMRVHSVATPK